MLDKILLLLGLDDETITDKVEAIMEMTEQRLMLMLGQSSIPDALSFVVVEVTIARFNRIGSEGTSSHSVSNESMTWSDDDFKPYKSDIQTWLNAQEDTTQGKVRFI